MQVKKISMPDFRESRGLAGAATSLNLCRDLALALQQFVQGRE